MPSLDTMMSYHRLKRAPLDDMEVFTSLSDLMDYCKNGACYEGQQVAVCDNKLVKYIIKKYNGKYIPIINMNGSEPIFKLIKFNGDPNQTHGLLIYENNSTEPWTENEVFNFNEDKLCIISQLEIFNIDGKYKFYIERLKKETNQIARVAWDQSYNPYTTNKSIPRGPGYTTTDITEMSFYNDGYSYLTANSAAILMPYKSDAVDNEKQYTTKIYIKAEDYYNALNG